jgi:hypothetical protein
LTGQADREIEAFEFLALDNLFKGVSRALRGTQRRIAEYLEGNGLYIGL